MTPTLWSIAVLAVTLASVLSLRALPKRVRLAVDLLCLIALSCVLYRSGMSPFIRDTHWDASAVGLRAAVVAWWMVSARVVVLALYLALRRDRRSRGDQLLFDLLAAAIYLGAVLTILNSALALPVGGLLATSGVFAIVLGLALQNTLADVFAGIAVGIEAPFKAGDRILLGSSTEGRVVEMNWRSIRLETDGGDVAVIPNSVVSKLEIVNRSVPTPRRTVTVDLLCPAHSETQRVIEVLTQATMLCPTVLEQPAPTVSLVRVGPLWHSYQVSFSVADTPLVSATKTLLLRNALTQLDHCGLLARGQQSVTRRATRPPPVHLLRRLVLFDPLSSAELETLAGAVVPHLLNAGDILFSQNSADCTLYVVASGILEVTKSLPSGEARSVGRLGAGEYLGEIGLLTGAPHAATVRAQTRCEVYMLPKTAIAPLLAANPDLAAAFDESARRGLDLLNRSVAVSATDVGARGDLLNRMRAFFRF